MKRKLFGTKYSLYDFIKILLIVVSLAAAFIFWTIVINAVFFNSPAQNADRIRFLTVVCAAVPLFFYLALRLYGEGTALEKWGICSVVSGTFCAVDCLIFFSLDSMPMTIWKMVFLLVSCVAGCVGSAGVYMAIAFGARVLNLRLTSPVRSESRKRDVMKYVGFDRK